MNIKYVYIYNMCGYKINYGNNLIKHVYVLYTYALGGTAGPERFVSIPTRIV